MNDDKDKRIKKLSVMAAIVFIFYIAGLWAATEYTAYKCHFDALLGSNILHIYPLWAINTWEKDFGEFIPDILRKAKLIEFAFWAIGGGIAYLYHKKTDKDTSHGSASFATASDIKKMGFDNPEGVILGINPFTGKLLRDDGDTHIAMVAPTRSGKGVGVIVPTLLTWKHSLIVTDVKGENWNLTAGFRKHVLHQKVLKFDPLCEDGSSAHWNPLTEVKFRTSQEYSDIQNIVSILSDSGDSKGNEGNDYFKNAGINLLQGVILHLMYAAYREHRRLPTLTDASNFLSSPERSIEEQLEYMKNYPHMSIKEFLEPVNLFEENYGEYITNYMVFSEALAESPEYIAEDGETYPPVFHNLNEIKQYVKTHLPAEIINSDSVPVPVPNDDDVSSGKYLDMTSLPWSLLLSHPRVASKATEVLNKADKEQSGVISMAKTCLSVYENPIISRNLAYSDFRIKDFLTLEHEVSLYLVIPPSELEILKNLIRLFIESILKTLVTRMEEEKRKPMPQLTLLEKMHQKLSNFKQTICEKMPFRKKQKSANTKKKQRLLLMCDEFPQFGTLTSLETALAVMAGYGIRACLIAQDINQLNKRYTERNSILSNCHVNVFYTPNQETNNATAKMISETLGSKTIKTKSVTHGKDTSTSEQSTGRQLMTSDEVSHMDRSRALIFMAGKPTIYAIKMQYFKFPYFTKRLMPAPVISDTVTIIKNFDDLLQLMREYFENLAARKELVNKELAKRDKEKQEQEKSPSLPNEENEEKSADEPLQEIMIEDMYFPSDLELSQEDTENYDAFMEDMTDVNDIPADDEVLEVMSVPAADNTDYVEDSQDVTYGDMEYNPCAEFEELSEGKFEEIYTNVNSKTNVR